MRIAPSRSPEFRAAIQHLPYHGQLIAESFLELRPRFSSLTVINASRTTGLSFQLRKSDPSVRERNSLLGQRRAAQRNEGNFVRAFFLSFARMHRRFRADAGSYYIRLRIFISKNYAPFEGSSTIRFGDRRNPSLFGFACERSGWRAIFYAEPCATFG